MKIGATATSAFVGALALAGAFAIPCGAQAAVLTVDLNDYDTSAVNSPGGVTLATMTVTDLSGGGVSVKFALDAPATFFASTGGGHITAAFNLDTAITAADITGLPVTPTFTFTSPVNGVPGPSGGFGNFSAGLQGNWTGTSNHFAGPIDFDIAGISVSDFVVNSKGFFAVADVLGNVGTGDVGGKTGTIVGTPEPSTWAMMLLGFAGLGFAGYRKARSARAALSAA
jgi:PEP-CTERM motif-containing protein